jgi:hypothetical protein
MYLLNSTWNKDNQSVKIPIQLIIIPAFISLLFILHSCTDLSAQPGIKGRIDLDTTRWTPMAYLSIIPDFTQM